MTTLRYVGFRVCFSFAFRWPFAFWFLFRGGAYVGEQDEVNTLDTSLQCLRYGLMEYGGFVRRRHMFVQERGNYVLWQMKTSAETTDAIASIPPNLFPDEGGEEESPADDEPIGAHGSPGSSTALLENMRLDQGIAVTNSWHNDASNIQQAMMVLLQSSSSSDAGVL